MCPVRPRAAICGFTAVPREDVILEFLRQSRQDAPNKRLQGFQGTIQTDAYEVYEAVVKKNPKIERIGCLAHARRYFYKALQESLGEAVWFIGKIRELYRIEYAARALDHPERHALRQVQAPPLWAVLQARAEELRRSCCRRAPWQGVNYFLKRIQSTRGYLRTVVLKSTQSHRDAIRPRRWDGVAGLFIGHPQAGWRSAVIYSLLLSCRRRGINPQSYLSDVLNRLPSTKITQIQELLLPSGNLHRRTLLETRLWLLACRRSDDEETYTDKQGQYLAFIYYYNKIHGCSPSEAELQHHFRVLSRLLCASDDLNARSTRPHRANARESASIQLLIPREEIPDLA